MTNKQKSIIKQRHAKQFQALRWNGNELIGKRKNDKQWSTVLTADQAKEIAAHV